MKFLKKMGKLAVIFLGLFIFFHLAFYVYCLFTPKIQISRNQSYYLYDNQEELMFNNYSWVELDNISNYLIDATISTEDKHFYNHLGFDYLRIGKAIINNILSGSLSEGASTITQQYARNLYLNYDKTWKRKIEEAILAFELETHYTKDEILEGYLNTINYGGVYGIENAARYYFDKSASELTLSEASMLAGIPQSPSNYSPLYNLELAKKRQRTVLTLMVDNDIISDKEMNDAINAELNYIGDKNNNVTSGLLYFKDAVLNELETISSIPASLLTTGGIKIYTTLDSFAQEQLENSINSKDMGELQLSSVLMDPDNGEVLALVGGTDYNSSQFNRATSAKRQVGSTMKPFLYYSALESGFTSASSFISEKTTFSLSKNSKYTPKNYNDKYANGPLSMGAAIAYSDNIYAVKTHLFLGEDKLVSMANRVGIDNELEAVPSLALGTEEITLMDMVSAYAAFANMGYKVEGHLIRRIEDSSGNILYEYKEDKVNILNESLVFILNEMLTYTYDKDFIDYNYPTMISLLPKMTNKYAIKSGTTNTDMWIMGYNQEAVLGVWIGYDDNRVLTNNDSGFHKEIWIEVMENYLDDKECEWYEAPNNVIGTLVNPITGELAKQNDKNSKIFYFLKGTEPYSDYSYDLDSVFDEDDDVENKDDEKKNDKEAESNTNMDNSSENVTNNNQNNDNNEENDANLNNDTDNSNNEVENNLDDDGENNNQNEENTDNIENDISNNESALNVNDNGSNNGENNEENDATSNDDTGNLNVDNNNLDSENTS